MSKLEQRLAEIESRIAEAEMPKLWTYRGAGVFSEGEEGVSLTDPNEETPIERLEYLAAAPETIEFLLAALKRAMEGLRSMGRSGNASGTQALADLERLAGGDK